MIRVPDHLIIIGGGYLGVEFAQIFCRLGSKVTIIQRNHRLLPKEDADFSAEIADLLRSEGVTCITGYEPINAQREREDDLRSPAAVRVLACSGQNPEHRHTESSNRRYRHR